MTGTWTTDWATGDIVTAAEFRKSLGLVADSTLGVSAASFDFTGLPTTYAHMMIITYLRSDVVAVNDTAAVRFNNDSGANYDSAVTGSVTVAQTKGQFGYAAGASSTANVFAITRITIPHYGGATGHKVYEGATFAAGTNGSAGTVSVLQSGGRWYGTPAALSRVTILPSSGNFVAGSRVSIYVMGS